MSARSELPFHRCRGRQVDHLEVAGEGAAAGPRPAPRARPPRGSRWSRSSSRTPGRRSWRSGAGREDRAVAAERRGTGRASRGARRPRGSRPRPPCFSRSSAWRPDPSLPPAAAAAAPTASAASGGCEWVDRTAVLLTPRPPLSRASRSARASPCPAQQMNVSRFPFGPGRPEEATPSTPKAQSWPRLSDGKRSPRGGPPATHHSALPDPLRPSSNWGFTIASSPASSVRQLATAGRTLRSEMKETSTVGEIRRERKVLRPSSRALTRSITVTRGSSRRLPVELPVADVERDHALRRRAGAGSRVKPPVEAPTSRQSRPATAIPSSSSAFCELDPAARNEARGRLDDQLVPSSDQLARLQREGPSRPMRTLPGAIEAAAPSARRRARARRGRCRVAGRPRGNGSGGPAAGAAATVAPLTHESHVRSYRV